MRPNTDGNEPLKEGYLLKQGPRLYKWRERWVKFQRIGDGRIGLTCYRGEKDTNIACFVGLTKDSTVHAEITHVSALTIRVTHTTKLGGTLRYEAKGVNGIGFRLPSDWESCDYSHLKEWFGLIKREIRQLQLPAILGISLTNPLLVHPKLLTPLPFPSDDEESPATMKLFVIFLLCTPI